MNRTSGFPAIIACACLCLAGCQRSVTSTHQDPDSRSDAAATASDSVDLSAAQLHTLRIEPVATGRFRQELDAVGTISFEEDPAVIQAEATLLSAQATLDASHRELLRVQGLGEANGIAPKELESARAADLSAAAAVKAAHEAVRSLGVPDGEVASLLRLGRFAAAGSAAATAWVLINVAESDSLRVRPGEVVRVSVPACPQQQFRGVVARVYATIDATTHRLAVRARLADPRHQLRPGMLANAVIEYGDPIDAIAIPTAAAVRNSDGTSSAWITTDRKHFTARHLTLGPQQQGRYPVLGGLQRGDLLVTEGGVFLSNLLAAPPSD